MFIARALVVKTCQSSVLFFETESCTICCSAKFLSISNAFLLPNACIGECRGKLPPHEIANRLASCARARGEDTQRHSPFAKAAMDAGHLYTGGKLDDITVVVSFVCSKHEIGVNNSSQSQSS